MISQLLHEMDQIHVIVMFMHMGGGGNQISNLEGMRFPLHPADGTTAWTQIYTGAIYRQDAHIRMELLQKAQ